MADDDAHGGPPGTAQADRLYRGFPDFSTWGLLSPEDADLWNRFAASLAERRQKATPEALKSAVEVAVRAAALDTGAIEGLYNVDRGFTMTVAVQGLAWEQMVEESGAGVRELFEAQLAAYELVLDAVTHKLPITEAWIRSLHELLCAPQKTVRVLTHQGWQEQDFPKGTYKSHPNHVLLTDGTVHAYAPVDLVPTEMHRLVEQVRTPEFEAAHPALQASYCHYAFVVIHPFADGNGRVARALASTFFYRAQSIPLVIFSNQRPAYLDALTLADHGDFEEVTRFFQDRGIDTMQLVAESLMTAVAPNIQDQALRISRAARAWRELSDADLLTISERILQEINQRLEAKVEELKSPDLSTSLSVVNSSLGRNDSYRSVAHTALFLRSRAPRILNLGVTIPVLFSCSPQPFPFVVSAYKREDQLEARLGDVIPELTPHFLLRLDQWVNRQLAYMLADLT